MLFLQSYFAYHLCLLIHLYKFFLCSLPPVYLPFSFISSFYPLPLSISSFFTALRISLAIPTPLSIFYSFSLFRSLSSIYLPLTYPFLFLSLYFIPCLFPLLSYSLSLSPPSVPSLLTSPILSFSLHSNNFVPLLSLNILSVAWTAPDHLGAFVCC